MALPILTMVVGGPVAVGMVLLMGGGTAAEGHAVTWFVGLVFSLVVSTGGILYLNWLDRWEPEPPHLLVAAFFWGGGVSILLALLTGAPFGALPEAAQAAFVAPVTEELSKGLFFFVVLLSTRRSRAELNSLTDALVYAGFIGIGFSFVEDVGYISGMATTAGEATGMVIARGVGAFSHSIYTAMTAIGVWKGLDSRGAMRVVWPLVGLAVAMLLHGIHNGSAVFGLGAFILSLLVFGVGGFVFYLVVGIRSRAREGRIVAAQLHPMVAKGWVSASEANWLATMRGRTARLRGVNGEERRRLRGVRDDATELAFVRDRLDAQVKRGETPSDALLAQHDQLVELLRSSQGWADRRLPAGSWPPPGR